MKVKLVVVGGKKDGMEIPISTPKFLIGRGNNCHIRPQSNLIGDLHCLISVGSDSVILEDCGGAVGTLVNGKKIQQRYKLQNNDRIKIATLEFTVQLTADEAAVKKQPILKTAGTAARTAASAADDREAGILQWVKQEEKVRTLPQEVVTLHHATPEKVPQKAPVAAAAPMPQTSDDLGKDFELESTDLLLLITVIPLVGVLLSFLPTFWAWRGGGGMILAALAWMFRTHMKRMNGIKWNELNVAIGVLAMLIVSLMLPIRIYLLWQWGAVILLMALSLVVVLRMKKMAGSKLDDTNVALLAAVTLLAYIVAKQLPITQWEWLGWSIVAVLALGLVLGVRIKGMAERKLDDTNAALLAAISLLAFIIVKMWSPATQWLRLGGAVVPLVALATLLGIRARRLTAKKLDGLNLLLVAQIGILSISFLYLMLSNSSVWRTGAVFLLIALIPLLAIRLVWAQGSRLNEINLALLLQIVLLGRFIAKAGIPSPSQLVALPTTAWWHWSGWAIIGIVILSMVLGVRMIRMSGSKLNDANVALLAAISLLAFMVVKMLPTAAQWVQLSGAVVPLTALVILFGIRAIRRQGNRLDGLNLLLLVQIGILAVSFWYLTLHNSTVWQFGVTFLLITSIPLLCIRMVRAQGSRLNEINLALLLQIGLLGQFVVKIGIPSTSQLFSLLPAIQLRWPGWGIIGIVVLSVVLGWRMMRMSSSKLNDANVALLAAIGLLAFMVVKLLPTAAQWVRLSGTVVPLIALAALFGIRARIAGSRLDRLNVLLLLQIGILTISVLHFVWPAFSVWRGGIILLLVAFLPLLGIGMVRMRGNRFNEISLALLLQMGALAYFTANWWLPSTLWPFSPRPTTLQLAALPRSASPPAKLLPNNARAVPAANAIANVAAPPANAKPPVNVPAKPLADAPAEPPANARANVPPANAPNKPLGDVPAKTPNKPDANTPADAPPEPLANVPANAPNGPQGNALAERPANAPAGPPAADILPANAIVNAPANLPPPNPPANPPGNIPAEAPANFPVADAPPAAPPANVVANAPAKPPTKAPAKLLTNLPPAKSLWATQWTGLGGVAVPLVVLISLFGIRTRRMTSNSFDGLSLLLLAQIGIFAISALHQILPNLSVWQGGAVFLALAMIPLLGISMVRTKEGKLNEVNLALLIQIGLLMLFVAQRWLPYQWTRLIVGVILILALVPFWRIRKAWKSGRRLNEIDLALLAQIGVFAFIIANQWLPSFWVRIGESVILLAGLAIILWFHEKRMRVGKSDQIILRLVAIGIALVVILGFLFPITSWG